MADMNRPVDRKTLEAFQSMVQYIPEEPPPDAMTIQELAALWGLSRTAAAGRVKKLLAEGAIEVLVARARMSVSGRTYPVPHYRIKK